MPPRPNSRNWNDVQTAIATMAIVSTLGLWNLFATPSKTETVQASEPVLPPTQPPMESTLAVMPQVKIMFTQAAPQATVIQQAQNKKKKNRNKTNGGGGGTVTQTQTS